MSSSQLLVGLNIWGNQRCLNGLVWLSLSTHVPSPHPSPSRLALTMCSSILLEAHPSSFPCYVTTFLLLGLPGSSVATALAVPSECVCVIECVCYYGYVCLGWNNGALIFLGGEKTAVAHMWALSQVRVLLLLKSRYVCLLKSAVNMFFTNLVVKLNLFFTWCFNCFISRGK